MDIAQRSVVMTHRKRPLRSIHSLVFLAIWSILVIFGGLALKVDGSFIIQSPNSHEDLAGPPAVQASIPPHPHSTEATEFSVSPLPPGHMIATPFDLDRTKIPTKPVSLDYLTQQLQSVRSHYDLIQIFADEQVNSGNQLTERVVRTPRSAFHAKQDIQMLKARLASHHPEIQWTDFIAQNPNYVEALKRQGTDLSVYDDYEDYPADEPNYEAFEAALHHIHEMNTCSSLQCKDPKPFVHLMRDPRHRKRVFIPQCTILHRCMNFTGCCGDSGRECVPKRMVVIFRAFIVVDRVTGHEGYVEFNPSMATMVPLINHTECECREKPRLPQCTKKCPIPFRLMREAYNCTCNCFGKAYEDHRQCEGVKEGTEQLSQDGLICIKEGHCYPPECIVGTFDVKRGYCPLSDEHSLHGYHFENPEDRRHYRKHLKNFDFRAAQSWSRSGSKRHRKKPTMSRSTKRRTGIRQRPSQSRRPSRNHSKKPNNSTRKRIAQTATVSNNNKPTKNVKSPDVLGNSNNSRRNGPLSNNSQVSQTSTSKRHMPPNPTHKLPLASKHKPPVPSTHKPHVSSTYRPRVQSKHRSHVTSRHRPHVPKTSTNRPILRKNSKLSVPNSSTDKPSLTKTSVRNPSASKTISKQPAIESSTSGALPAEGPTESSFMLQTSTGTPTEQDKRAEISQSNDPETTVAVEQREFSNSSSYRKSEEKRKIHRIRPLGVTNNIISNISKSYPPGHSARNSNASLPDLLTARQRQQEHSETEGRYKSTFSTPFSSTSALSRKRSQSPTGLHRTFTKTQSVSPIKLENNYASESEDIDTSTAQYTAFTSEEMDRSTSRETSLPTQQSNIVTPQPRWSSSMPQDVSSSNDYTGQSTTHRVLSSVAPSMSTSSPLRSTATVVPKSEASHIFKSTILNSMYIDDMPDLEYSADSMEGSGENFDWEE